MKNLLMLALVGFTVISTPLVSLSAPKKSVCVFDPSGRSGPGFNLLKDFRTKALALGADLDLKPYTDEKTAMEDFKTGQCDGAVITGTRLRPFHKFAGTLEAMGALPTYSHLGTVVKSLSKAKASKLMGNEKYKVAGIFSGGAIYLFVNDKKMNTVSALAGKRLATMSYDDAAKTMVKKVGASMTAADVSTFAGLFNNGSVDACYAPPMAYQALELYKGIGEKGGVIRYPLAQMTLQFIIHADRFPDAFAEGSRKLAAQLFSKGEAASKQAEKTIPAKHWIEIPPEDKARYDEMFLDVRIELRDKAKVYDATALKLLRKVRCSKDKTRAECVTKRE